MANIFDPYDTEREREDEDDVLVTDVGDLVLATPHQGPTLLPGGVAAFVSTVTGVGALGVKIGTKFGGWGLFAGREATLRSLSVTRTVVEQVLVLAGRDVAARGSDDLGQVEAANILEKSMSVLYSTISTASFIASAGFYLTESTINSATTLSLHTLSMLNAICGSTESSRAVAAIITLLKDELNKPEQGEVIGYRDIVVGVIGFLLLQRWGRRKTQLDFLAAGGEETIWDTVIDDKGFRADVVGTRRKETITLQPKHGNSLVFDSQQAEIDIETAERGMLFDPQQMELDLDEQSELTDDEIRQKIISQLPKTAKAVITTEIFTARTIKVEIYDSDTAQIEAPPGTIMVAERLDPNVTSSSEATPKQTVIFRTSLKRSNSTGIESGKSMKLTSATAPHGELYENDDYMTMKTSPKRREISHTFDDHVESSDDDFDAISPGSKPIGTTANQKKSRKPLSLTSSKIPTPVPAKEKANQAKNDKTKTLKKALKALSPNQLGPSLKENQNILPRKRTDDKKVLPRIVTTQTQPEILSSQTLRSVRSMSNSHTPLASPVFSPTQQTSVSHFSVQDSRGDSTISKTKTYSVRSIDSRPGSPTFFHSQTQARTVNGLTQTKSEIGLSVQGSDSRPGSSGDTLHHQRSRSFVPSLYSMGSKRSGEAIILAPKTAMPRKSIYEDQKMIDMLITDGKVPGVFPDRHLIKTIRRFSRFAIASYGSGFLSFFGLTDEEKKLSKSKEVTPLDVHQEHSSFSNYTGLPTDSILLSSFLDPQGVMGNTQWSSSAISPLIHFISIDHDSKAVVLTCRGTLGFEDVLTDLACDYNDITWQGHKYTVHKGIHASAVRLLAGRGSRVMDTLKTTLEDYPDYGLVLCGHSLGGAVAALVAILVSEPCEDQSKTAFVTSSMPKFLTNSAEASRRAMPAIQLPTGRPIHVYAYGPPATMSEPLRLATRGLITTTINASDIVPCLSLGTLHDFRAVALHLKHDSSDAIEEVKARVWRRVKNAFTPSALLERDGAPPPENIAGDGLGEDNWAWSTLKTLRAAMVNNKLVPPGEVFVVETTRVFDRLGPDVRKEAVFGPGDNPEDRAEKLYRALGRPATRVQFKLVRDVPARFAEIRFGRDMFGDHSPTRYEASLNALEKGICD